MDRKPQEWVFENARPEDFCTYENERWLILWIADGQARIKSVVGMKVQTVDYAAIKDVRGKQ